MSSAGAAAGSSGLSTLSTSLLAAACTAVVAALIFVLVALRRYLRARKRKSLMIAASPAPFTAEAIYASHIKAKSISTDDIGQPRLSYAPERAHHASYDLTKMSLAQKTVVSMQQQGFLPKNAFKSPKFPQSALLSPRMQPPVSAEVPPPRTPLSPGLTELTMSPGPSILLKPIMYGKSPRLTSPSQSSINKEKKKESPEQKKQLTRSAIPSVLLRSLGVLPSLSADALSASAPEESIEMAEQQPAEADEASLTPILDLGIDFGNDDSFEQSLKLRSDFVFNKSSETLVGSSVPEQTKTSQKSSVMASLIQALSPAQPDTATLPTFRASPSAKMMTGLPSPASVRSHLPTPPPSAGLPPAPSSASMYKVPSNSSLKSKASGTTTSSAASANDSFHSATGIIGQLCINMPPIEAVASRSSSENENEGESSYRPLSLGLGPAKSPSQSTFHNILGNLRKMRSRDDNIDLEAANSSIDGTMTSRSYSSDALSYSSSQTSLNIDPNTSFGKANVVPAASVPPLPPMPVSYAKPVEEQTPRSKSTAVLASDATTATDAGLGAPRRPRKRASTLGALDQPKLVLPDLMHPRAAPMPPAEGVSAKTASPSINVEPVEVNQVGLMNLKSKSSDHLPLKSSSSSKSAMNFMSPYHRTLIPDPPTEGARLSPGLGADSPILAQLSPKFLATSPASPKPSFTESLKARLSLKSLTGSPSMTSRNSTPRLSTLDQFPQPNGDSFQTLESEGSTKAINETTPKMRSSKPAKSPKRTLEAARPATSPNIGQKEVGLGFSPAILFNGQEIEPTRPLRFKKPSSAGGRLGGSPSSMLSPASPSPMLHADRWGTPAANSEQANVLSPSSVYSPLVGDEPASPSGDRIEFGTPASHVDWNDATPLQGSIPATPALPLEAKASPQIDEPTPRPASSEAFALADDEHELEYLSHRDSMVSVAASTISMMSNSTCMSDSMGEDLDQAADRRTKLLASVQENLAKAKAKDAKRESHAANRFRKSQMPKSSSLRNIPEELSGGAQTMGLGLFESEEEDEDEEEKENLSDSPQGRKKPNNLVLMPQHDSRLVEPLTPPHTPVDATALQKQSRHVATPSTSSASSASSYGSIPRRLRPSQGRLAPIDTGMANRLSPSDSRDGASSPSSLKLRPLSLAASLHGDGSPMKRFDRPAFSPALPSPVPVHVAGLNERSSRYNEEGRSSRSTTYRHGGVLPTISSKGAVETGRVGHAEPSLTHSDSTTSMGSMASSLGSFSRMGNFPSPVKSSFSYHTGGKISGMRPVMPELTSSPSDRSLASSTGGRLGYKTSDLSVAAI